MKNLPLLEASAYENAYNDFKDTKQFKKLVAKYEIKPYYKKFKRLQQTIFSLSFFLNAFSIATAASFTFSFLTGLIPNIYICAVLCFISLLLLESLKRFTIPIFFKDILQSGFKLSLLSYLAIISCLVFTSVCLSYKGAATAIQEYKPAAELISTDSIKHDYKQRIAALTTKQTEIKNAQSWKGKLTRQGQKTFNEIERQISALSNKELEDLKTAEAENKELLLQDKKQRRLSASSFAIVALIFDLLLLVCLWFLEYYDFRSFAEFQQPPTEQEQQNNNDNKKSYNLVATSDNAPQQEEEVLKLAIKKAKANIAAYRSKLLNNQGKKTTNKEGLKRWTDKLQHLQKSMDL